MSARDPHRFVNELGAESVQRLVARLEARAKDAVFTRLFEQYAHELPHAASAHLLEIGCGTGAMVRALAARPGFEATVLGVDHSPVFVAAARCFAREAGLPPERFAFEVGDAQSLTLADACFDAVFAHTLLSHVGHPRAVLAEMARVLKPGGLMVVFDGDYSSMTFRHPDRAFGRRMDNALVTASFANPHVMGELPRLAPALGLELTGTRGDSVAEIGRASYFKSFVDTYAPYIVAGGLATQAEVDTWLAELCRAMQEGEFFASCSYYTYYLRKR